MTGFVLSPAARTDIEHIWDYTVDNWGVDQAERYVRGIREACEVLANGHRQGRAVDEIRAGYLKLAVGSHFLFYRITGDGQIDVVRILHRRMDVPARLSDP